MTEMLHESLSFQNALILMILGGAVTWMSIRKRCEKEGHQNTMSEQDYADAVDLAAEAFKDSPAYMWFGGEQQWRKEQLKWLFAINFRLQQKKGNVCRLFRDKQGVAVCFFMLQPPAVAASTLESLWQLFYHFLPRYGWTVYLRLAKIVSALERQKKTAMESVQVNHARCLTLERMVVHPSHQGQGIGSTNLGATLSAEAGTSAVVLTTQEERNVRFYRRLGFEVAADDSVEGLGRSWVLVRRPPVGN